MDLFEYVGDTILNFLKSVLPVSPFAATIEKIASLPYLAYLNWFVPVGTFVSIGTVWLTCVGLYYLYSILLRWVKAIQ